MKKSFITSGPACIDEQAEQDICYLQTKCYSSPLPRLLQDSIKVQYNTKGGHSVKSIASFFQKEVTLVEK